MHIDLRIIEVKMAGKYDKLEAFFFKTKKKLIRLTFNEIEEILGFKLSESAYKYSAIWSNSDSHHIARTWLKTGYKSENIDIENQCITFRKVDNKSNTSLNSNRESTLGCEEAVRLIRDYYNETIEDEHGRYLSWRHCYKIFRI